jgi:hypothetical protein
MSPAAQWLAGDRNHFSGRAWRRRERWPVTHFTPTEAIRLMDEGGVDAAVINPPFLV